MTSPATPVDTAARSSSRLTYAVLALAVGSYALLQSLVTPVLPTIQEALHTSQATVTWVLTAYLLSASVFTPIIGRIGDKVGKERMFVVTMGALAVGSLLAALATSIGVLIVARVIQGIGGGVLPLAFGIVRDEFPKQKVAGAVGSLASLAAVGAGLGIVLAGPIVSALDYHWLFWIPMVFVLVAGVLAHLVVPESPVRTEGSISVAPAVLLSAWLVALLLGLSQAPQWGWTSGKVLGLIALAAVLAVAWVMVEKRSKAPLIDMDMMRLPAVWTTNVVALLVGVGMYASFGFLPQFVQTPTSAGYGFGASITHSGLLLLPSSVTMFVTGTYAARFAVRFGAKAVIVAGCAVGALSLSIMAFAHDEQWELFLATAILGIGVGLAFAAMSSLVVAAVPAAQTGVASGMNANIRTIGGSVGAALMASLVTAQLAPSGLPTESGYTHGFAFLAGAMVVAALAGLAIPAVTAHRSEPVDTDAEESAAEDDPARTLQHGELALVAGGTVVGDGPE